MTKGPHSGCFEVKPCCFFRWSTRTVGPQWSRKKHHHAYVVWWHSPHCRPGWYMYYQGLLPFSLLLKIHISNCHSGLGVKWVMHEFPTSVGLMWKHLEMNSKWMSKCWKISKLIVTHLFSLVQVLMGDYSTEFRPVDSPLEHVGYCPQVNPLWPRITLQEHLEIYAAIKGLRGQDVPGIIKRWVSLHSYKHNEPSD